MADITAKSGEVPVAPPQRRNFFAEAAAVVIGGFVGLFPFAAGLAAFLDPLRRSRMLHHRRWILTRRRELSKHSKVRSDPAFVLRTRRTVPQSAFERLRILNR